MSEGEFSLARETGKTIGSEFVLRQKATFLCKVVPVANVRTYFSTLIMNKRNVLKIAQKCDF
jgi:hypothetical protein